MKILGIAAYYHDSSASLVIDGNIVAACQEERFTRVKFDASFPVNSIQYCLKAAGLEPGDIDTIVFYEKPFLKFERLLETYLAFAPSGFLSFTKAMPLWLNEKLFQKKLLRDELKDLGFNENQTKDILFSSHHLSHAASAFFPSPYEEAYVLTLDGVGEWDTTAIFHGKGSELKKLEEQSFPHSLGLLYSAFTYYCGFKVNSGEYKLMGLAPYGVPIFADTIKDNLIDIKGDGSFRLNMKYFNFATGLTMTNKRFDDLFSNNLRGPEDEIKQVHMDIAASIQAVLEEIVMKICRYINFKYRAKNLCLAGGVALNCVANGKIRESGLFENIWVQPAAGDAGGSLGAALAVYYSHLQNPRTVERPDAMHGAYLGPSYSDTDVENFLTEKKAVFKRLEDQELLNFTSQELQNEKVIGWFQGRMEFGPRALGNRSILADARSEKMQKILNLKTKFRESFRPFAPIVSEEKCSDWFDFDGTSPYMLMVAKVREEKRLEPEVMNYSGLSRVNDIRSVIPAVTHVDNSARIQTVNKDVNPRLHALISKFEEATKTPVLINTSFNIRSEPIVCSPEDAYRCFMGCNMDILVLNNYVLQKEDQPEENQKDYRHLFEKD
jgi:carbamoyltransferase